MSEFTEEERVALCVALGGIYLARIAPTTLKILNTSNNKKIRCIGATLHDLNLPILGMQRILKYPERYTQEAIHRFADRLEAAFVELEGGETSHEQADK